jgi:hypothetical protein
MHVVLNAHLFLPVRTFAHAPIVSAAAAVARRLSQFQQQQSSTAFAHHCCRAAGNLDGVPEWHAAALLIT